jgi:hypothetical protein
MSPRNFVLIFTAIGTLATGIFFAFNIAGLITTNNTKSVTSLPLHEDMIFCVLIYQIVPNILNCGYEVAKLQYDSTASWGTHGLLYILLTLATVFSIAAPAVYGAAVDSSRELNSTILTFCASFILICNGCVGVFQIASQKKDEEHQDHTNNIQRELERVTAEREELKAERDKLNREKEAGRRAKLEAIELQKKAKRRFLGLKKKPKTTNRTQTFSLP